MGLLGWSKLNSRPNSWPVQAIAMDAPNKWHFLSRPPGWCLFPAGVSQSFSFGVCAPGHQEETFALPAM